jgi:hypothetical protein
MESQFEGESRDSFGSQPGCVLTFVGGKRLGPGESIMNFELQIGPLHLKNLSAHGTCCQNVRQVMVA